MLAASREEAWERVASIIDETRNLVEAWPTLGEEGRKALLDYWVYHVQIAVEPIPNMKRANEKFAVVTLRTAPYDPKFFSLGGQAARAAVSSNLTASSDSTEDLDDNATLASADPTRPSAQAACARTSGSGSESATVNTGTASGERELPSPTATLRAKPARPARRIAEPRENPSHASSDKAMESNSTSEGEFVPGCASDDMAGSASTPTGRSPGPRAAYDGSELGSEKVWVNGQTSWEECPLPRYVIPLQTGRFRRTDG